ncbi:hypothetical protein AB4Z46_07380 [Variovorax sp. M-6]|uniref:PKD domain-containing protein n=1 Tax=Variovorax sp. M-6 TaxID=3233041 RepID=UPI003F99B6DD
MLTKRTIGIDASKSTGINGAAVSYLWNLVSKPSGSTTQIFDPTPPMTTLWADIPGTYTLKLVVSSGGKTSAPAYVVVKAVAPGALPAFATFNASGFKISDSAVLSGCAYYRRVANYGNFWDFISNPYDFSCLFQSSADAERQGGFSGGQLSGFAQNFSLLQGSGISGTSQITRADVNTVSGYEFKTSAEIIELSKVPAGKATGTVLAHQVAVANPAPYTSGTLQYKIGGSFVPTNVPAGWEMAQEMTVKVVLSGTTFDNNQAVLESFTIFEKTFTSDFSETIPLEMTWSQLPASFTGNFASYGAVVVHRMTLKRANE